MQRGRITEFLFNNDDYFVARTDMPGVRIGMVGGICFDIPTGHAYHDRVREIENAADAEEMFDELYAALIA
ncbi:hypothetical protein WM32_09360 [Burkholderia ubonensis]|uniref:hypothetical protein n=1 Tax=Burkholderia TaxID=32008 RepID=UPI00075D47DB|nr:hypothetical protein [Burkholderia ubonensis]KWO88641.1 hypothetical protein WM32_09360 [Burkholderia ubonensis]